MINIGKRVWVEDDCTFQDSDHETLEKAWRRIFGEKLNLRSRVEYEDIGDALLYLMPNGYIAILTVPGNCTIHAEKKG